MGILFMQGCGQKAARRRTGCNHGEMPSNCCRESTIVAHETRCGTPHTQEERQIHSFRLQDGHTHDRRDGGVCEPSRRHRRSAMARLAPAIHAPSRLQAGFDFLTTDTPSHSRGVFRPSFALSFTPSVSRGRREDRVPAGTRGPLCANSAVKLHSGIQVKPETPGLPCAVA
jgi:hypothetical protein